MKYPTILLGLLLAGCAGSPYANLQESRNAYGACLNSRPAAECENQRARFEMDMAVMQQRQSAPPLVLQPYRPPPPVQPQTYPRDPGAALTTCYNFGGIIQCY